MKALRTACLVVGLSLSCTVVDRPVGRNIACTDGACACVEGNGDCDGAPENGCETDLQSDPEHCGSCAAVCDHGDCVGGECMCQPGFFDCDQLDGNGCEAELASDSVNCGACGYDCFGGACRDGVCKPHTLAEVDMVYHLGIGFDHAIFSTQSGTTIDWLPLDLSSAPETLVDAGGVVRRLAVDSSGVYWSTDTGIWSMVPGAAPRQLAQQAVSDGLWLGPSHVAWTSGTDLLLASKSSGAVSTLVTTTVPPMRAVLTDTFVFFDANISGQPPGLFRAALPSGVAESLVAENVRAVLLGAHEDGIYFADMNAQTFQGAMFRIGQQGGTPSMLATDLDMDLGLHSVVADESGIYDGQPFAATLSRLRLDGSEPVTILTDGENGIKSLCVDDTFVYWITWAQIRRLRK